MTTKGKLRDHKDSIIALYNHVGSTPFYTQDIDHLINSKIIGSMSMKRLIEPTGESQISNTKTQYGRTYKQWRFSDKGIAWVTSFMGLRHVNGW